LRVAVSGPIRAKTGKPLGGPAPLATQCKEKKLVVDANQPPFVKLMF